MYDDLRSHNDAGASEEGLTRKDNLFTCDSCEEDIHENDVAWDGDKGFCDVCWDSYLDDMQDGNDYHYYAGDLDY